MKGIKFTESIIINEQPEAIFDLTQNYDRRLDWDTFLVKAQLIEGASAAGKGVRACCVAHNGLAMETEYVSFNRPKVTAIKMTKGPHLFKSFHGSWVFKPEGEGKTCVTFLYAFKFRFPFSIVQWYIKQRLQVNVRQRLSDLKQCVES